MRVAELNCPQYERFSYLQKPVLYRILRYSTHCKHVEWIQILLPSTVYGTSSQGNKTFFGTQKGDTPKFFYEFVSTTKSDFSVNWVLYSILMLSLSFIFVRRIHDQLLMSSFHVYSYIINTSLTPPFISFQISSIHFFLRLDLPPQFFSNLIYQYTL